MATCVSLCVCTYRRPGVGDTIRSLLAQRGFSPSDVEIIVADDDPGLSAREMVRNIANTAVLPVRYVVSAAQNISSCRNICLNNSTADWIAFIDDDQVAEPQWLQQMVFAAEKFGADAVKSYVRAIYPSATPDWIRAGAPYTYDYGKTGAEVRFADTCGILFRRDLPGARELFFDTGLGCTGGEDTEFFLRYRELGGRIISCQSAIAEEIVPIARVDPSYLQKRCRRQGQVNGRIRFAKKTPFGRALSVAKSVIVVVITSSYPLVRPIPGALACRGFMKFWYHLGVLEWALGRAAFYHE
jgi:succinoglycan biosynthesis protein ExoM